jgi:RNA polymerase sigma factor (sigma-70 family)
VSNRTTSESLLLRLRLNPADELAWERFVDGYGPLIRAWCRSQGLREADTQDVCQDVLAKLVTVFKTFSYDPSRRFRGWLRMIVEHALCDYHHDRRNQPARGSGDTRVVEILSQQKARDELAVRLEEAYDVELFQLALTTVKSKVAPHNWQAFVQNALEGRPVAETAQMLGLHEGMIYVARCKIQKMLKREIERLETTAYAEESISDGDRRVPAAQRTASLR